MRQSLLHVFGRSVVDMMKASLANLIPAEYDAVAGRTVDVVQCHRLVRGRDVSLVFTHRGTK